MGNAATKCFGPLGVWTRDAGPRIQFDRTTSQLPLKKRVQEFWQNAPCDSWFTHEPIGTRRFFEELDLHRYRVHPHLLSAIDLHKTQGMRVLEIGCGCGSEAERFARAGASYTGLDLTHAAVALTQERFRQAQLPGSFIQGDAENLPFDDASFDLVYSHGVLHHTPDTARAVRELYRVLAPGGRAVVMLYHRNSFNYRINIGILRRLRAIALQSGWGLAVMQNLWGESKVQLLRHAQLFRQDPCAYWEEKNMLNRNTDGPDNPLSQAFSKRSARQLFRQFKSVSEVIKFWNPNWLPVVGKLLPNWLEDKLTAHWGWHLWIYATKSERRSTTVFRPIGVMLKPAVTGTRSGAGAPDNEGAYDLSIRWSQ